MAQGYSCSYCSSTLPYVHHSWCPRYNTSKPEKKADKRKKGK